jgi:UDP-N-acetylmuramoyl-L-alanyl-D-glutamate--2,6-diaminopimelate ligase
VIIHAQGKSLGVFIQEMHPTRLGDLIAQIQGSLTGEIPDVPVTGIVLDSRQVKAGNIFVALEGGRSDGHLFIPEAIEGGAAAVIGTQRIDDLAVPYIRVEDGRSALAQVSAAFYAFPARELTVIGVTGTDGKTTTANMIYRILRSAGLQVGMISTVNAQIGEKVLDTGFHVTTPEAPDVQRYLAEMVTAGLTHVVLEATSHGLDQQRIAACEIDVAVVTNITHEHLDYHGSYEAYRAAKGRLFSELAVTAPKEGGNPRLAVLNRDDRSHDYLLGLVQALRPAVRVITYGTQPGVTVRGRDILPSPDDIRFTTEIGNQRIEITSNLVGEYNVLNCLAAIAATVEGLHLDGRYAQEGISAMQGISGRMERIEMGQDFLAMVDFAHTPNALKRALQTARTLTQGKVIAVFGSAGLRDKEKRRMMAEISAELADLTVLTAEDPRTESLDGILEEMAAGAVARGGQEGVTFWRVPDRGEAIRVALRLAKAGDVVMACGKGHEQSMCFGEVEYPWDDRTAIRAALGELLEVAGTAMPYLPTQGKQD